MQGDTANRIWFTSEYKGEKTEIRYEKERQMFICTCKDASHFTSGKVIPCEHIAAAVTWLTLNGYTIYMEEKNGINGMGEKTGRNSKRS